MPKAVGEDLMTITPRTLIAPVNLRRSRLSFISPATKSLWRPNRNRCVLDSGELNIELLLTCVALMLLCRSIR